jgi:FeS assembly SUF system protein
MITSEAVESVLKTIYDPEIPVNIYDLGLIYNIQVIAGDVYIIMTLTTATCPAAAFLPEQVNESIKNIEGVKNVHVDVVYEPRWTKDRMSKEAKTQLGFA